MRNFRNQSRIHKKKETLKGVRFIISNAMETTNDTFAFNQLCLLQNKTSFSFGGGIGTDVHIKVTRFCFPSVVSTVKTQ